MDQGNFEGALDSGYFTDESAALASTPVFYETVSLNEESVDKHGMSDEAFDSYVNYRNQTLEICEDYLAFYTANPEYQLEF